MYTGSTGLRLSEEMESKVWEIVRQRGWNRTQVLRYLLELGLASYTLDPVMGGFLDALVGRLDAVAERLEASAGFGAHQSEVLDQLGREHRRYGPPPSDRLDVRPHALAPKAVERALLGYLADAAKTE